MRLPNAADSIVQPSKILDYLLNPRHRMGASKCEFFARHGFSRERWEELAEALKAQCATCEVGKIRQTEFGTLYEVKGPIDTPSGKRPLVCSVWHLDKGRFAPRLITAYPV